MLEFTPRDLALGALPPASGFNTTMLAAPWRPFTRGDMPGADRNQIVDDGGHVWQSTLTGTDRATYSPLTCRNEVWLGKDQGGGYTAESTVFVGLGLWLAPDYPTPPGWSTCGFQLHTPSNYPAGYASPMVNIESSGGTLKVQNNALGLVVDTWDYERGRWHYLLLEILISQQGYVRLWRALDELPDPSKSPTAARNMPTLPPSPGSDGLPLQKSWTKYGQYRKIGDTNTNIIRLDAPTEAPSMSLLVDSLRGRIRSSALAQTDTALAALERSWAHFLTDRPGPRGAWTQDQRWRADNPGQLQKLLDYRGGGPKPDLGIDGTGARMVEFLTGWLGLREGP